MLFLSFGPKPVSHLLTIPHVPVVQLLSRVPMIYSTPGFPVLRYLPEFAHVPWVSDAAISSSVTPSSAPALNLSQHQGPMFLSYV